MRRVKRSDGRITQMDYQNKRFRRGKKPSSFYRQTHPFPTRASTFGVGEYVMKNGIEFRVADGVDRIASERKGLIAHVDADSGTLPSQEKFYYRIPAVRRRRPKERMPKKPQIGRLVGTRIELIDLVRGIQFSGVIDRHEGQIYGKGNTGAVWLRDIRAIEADLPDLQTYMSNSRGVIARKLRRL